MSSIIIPKYAASQHATRQACIIIVVVVLVAIRLCYGTGISLCRAEHANHSPLEVNWSDISLTELLVLNHKLQDCTECKKIRHKIFRQIYELIEADRERLNEVDTKTLLDSYKSVWRALHSDHHKAYVQLIHERLNRDDEIKAYTQGELEQIFSHSIPGLFNDQSRSQVYVRWVSSTEQWKQAPPQEVLQLINNLEQEIEAQDVLKRYVIERMAEDVVWLVGVSSLSSFHSMLDELDDEQLKYVRRAFLNAQSENGSEWIDISLHEFENVRQVVDRLRLNKQIMTKHFHDWIVHSKHWQDSSPYTLVLIMEGHEEAKCPPDDCIAKTLLLDHILSRIEYDSYAHDAKTTHNYARFVVYLALAMQQDARFSESRMLEDSLASILNASDLFPRNTSIDFESRNSLNNAWYKSYQLHACGGGPSWGEGTSEKTGWIAQMIHRGLISGEIEPRPTTLYLMGWHFQGQGQLDTWKAYLNQQITSTSAASGKSIPEATTSSLEIDTDSLPETSIHTSWLLGRAYAEEITPVDPDPLAGKRWLLQALDSAGSDAEIVMLLKLLALKYTVAGETGSAEALLDEWATKSGCGVPQAEIDCIRELVSGIDQNGPLSRFQIVPGMD